MPFITNEIATYLNNAMSERVYVDILPIKGTIAVFNTSGVDYYQSEVDEYVLLIKIRVKNTEVDDGFEKTQEAWGHLHKKSDSDFNLTSYYVARGRCGAIVKDLAEIDDYYDFTFPLTIKVKEKSTSP